MFLRVLSLREHRSSDVRPYIFSQLHVQRCRIASMKHLLHLSDLPYLYPSRLLSLFTRLKFIPAKTIVYLSSRAWRRHPTTSKPFCHISSSPTIAPPKSGTPNPPTSPSSLLFTACTQVPITLNFLLLSGCLMMELCTCSVPKIFYPLFLFVLLFLQPPPPRIPFGREEKKLFFPQVHQDVIGPIIFKDQIVPVLLSIVFHKFGI